MSSLYLIEVSEVFDSVVSAYSLQIDEVMEVDEIPSDFIKSDELLVPGPSGNDFIRIIDKCFISSSPYHYESEEPNVKELYINEREDCCFTGTLGSYYVVCDFEPKVGDYLIF